MSKTAKRILIAVLSVLFVVGTALFATACDFIMTDNDGSYTVTVNCGENGTVELDPDTGYYALGTEVTATIKPDSGYELDTFLFNGLERAVTGNAYTFEVKGYVTLTVTFKELPAGMQSVALAFDDSKGDVTLDCGENATIGSTVTGTVAPKEGYTVATVTVNGEAVEVIGNTFTFKVGDEAIKVVVTFRLKDIPALFRGTWASQSGDSWNHTFVIEAGSVSVDGGSVTDLDFDETSVNFSWNSENYTITSVEGYGKALKVTKGESVGYVFATGATSSVENFENLAGTYEGTVGSVETTLAIGEDGITFNGEETIVTAADATGYTLFWQGIEYTLTQEEGGVRLQSVGGNYLGNSEVSVNVLFAEHVVYELEKAPTYTQTGTARGSDGSQKILPVLNDVNYLYTENSGEGVATFYFEELDITVTKTLTAEISITPMSGDALKYNNVNCHFTVSVPSLSISYDDETEAFAVATEAGKTVELAEITAVNLVVAGEGTLALYSTLRPTSLTVKSGATLNISDVGWAINDPTSLVFEADSNVNISANDNAIRFLKAISAKMYGNLSIKNSNADQTKTAIYAYASDVVIELSDTSCITVEDFEYAIGRWGTFTNALLRLPIGATQTASGDLGEHETASWYVVRGGERRKVITLINCKYANFANCGTEIQTIGDYTVVTKPTTEATGLATVSGSEDVTLPRLNRDDYAIQDNGSEVVFMHYETGIAFTVEVEGARMTVNGTVYNSLTAGIYLTSEDVEITYADGVYTITVATGKTVEWTSLTGATTDFVIAGEGTLKLYRQITVHSLTVKSGANLYIDSTGIGMQAAALDFEAGSNVTVLSATSDGIVLTGSAKLFGTLFVKDSSEATSKTGINIKPTAEAVVEMSATSRITVAFFSYSIRNWSNPSVTVKLIRPVGTTQTTASGDLESGENLIWYVVRGVERQKILRLVNCQYTGFTNITMETLNFGDYTVVENPTASATGRATAGGKPEITLPALNGKDYGIADNGTNSVTFTHYETGLTFTVEVAGARITIDGVTYNSYTLPLFLTMPEGLSIVYADNTYTVTVAAGKTVEFSSLSGTDLVIAGEGTLKLRSTLTVKTLTVKSGANLDIELESEGIGLQATTLDFEAGSNVTIISNNNDAIVVSSTAKLFGTLYVDVVNYGSSKKTGIKLGTNGTVVTLSATSRITIKHVMYAFAAWGVTGTVELPEGATQTASADLEDENSGWYVASGEEKQKILKLYDCPAYNGNVTWSV